MTKQDDSSTLEASAATAEKREQRRQAIAADQEGWNADVDGGSMGKSFTFADHAEAARFAKRAERLVAKSGVAATHSSIVMVAVPVADGKPSAESRALIRRLNRAASGDVAEASDDAA